MRTVILILAMMVKDVAVANGGEEFSDRAVNFTVFLFYVFLVMDIVDFIMSIQ